MDLEKENQRQKDIFAKNLLYWLKAKNKTQMDLMTDLNLSSSTVSDWCNAKKFPRMGTVQMLADYLDIQKSDLIEEKTKIDDIYMYLAKEAEKLKLDREDVEYIINLYKKYKK